MLKFNLSKYRVEVDPTSLLLSRLREVWESDKTKTKEMATRLLSYVHLASQIDPDAPFAATPPTEVKQLVIANLWRGEEMPSVRDLSWLDPTISDYRESYETPDRRAVRRFNAKIDQLSKLVEDTTPEIKPVASGFKSNTSILTSLMKEIVPLMDARDALAQRIAKQAGRGANLMGSKKESLLEQQHREKAQTKK
jgi:hypothetical protein